MLSQLVLCAARRRRCRSGDVSASTANLRPTVQPRLRHCREHAGVNARLVYPVTNHGDERASVDSYLCSYVYAQGDSAQGDSRAYAEVADSGLRDVRHVARCLGRCVRLLHVVVFAVGTL